MKLSERLCKVVEMVPKCDVVADIGTDHGYVPIHLIKDGRCKRAIAMDVNKGPLERAMAHIQAERLENEIETRLSDGLCALNCDEANTVIIAGLGGELMIRILQEGKEVLSGVETCILSPHSEWKAVRIFLLQNGFVIEEEQMVLDDGKYYVIMKVGHGQEKDDYTEPEYLYGRHLITDKNPILLEYLKKEQRKYREILVGMTEYQTSQVKERQKEIHWELEQIETILKGFGEHGWQIQSNSGGCC